MPGAHKAQRKDVLADPSCKRFAAEGHPLYSASGFMVFVAEADVLFIYLPDAVLKDGCLVGVASQLLNDLL